MVAAKLPASEDVGGRPDATVAPQNRPSAAKNSKNNNVGGGVLGTDQDHFRSAPGHHFGLFGIDFDAELVEFAENS